MMANVKWVVIYLGKTLPEYSFHWVSVRSLTMDTYELLSEDMKYDVTQGRKLSWVNGLLRDRDFEIYD